MTTIEDIDRMIDDPQSDRLKLYENVEKLFKDNGENNVEYCWRLVYICLILSDMELKENRKSESKKWEEKAYEYAKKAIELDPKSMNAHKWFCAAVGRMAPHVSTKERIQMGHKFKEHRDIAVDIDSNDSLMHHMYGRWCWEVANLSFVERQIAKTFFGTPPTATFDEALESLKKAHELRSDWKNNHYWMAKVLISKKQYSDAIKWIDDGLKLPSITEEDGVAEQELQTYVKSYAKYR